MEEKLSYLFEKKAISIVLFIIAVLLINRFEVAGQTTLDNMNFKKEVKESKNGLASLNNNLEKVIQIFNITDISAVGERTKQ